MLLVSVLCYIPCILYGTFSNVHMLDMLSMIFCSVFGLDTVARVLALGWQRFWYNHADVFAQLTNRYDFFLSAVTFVLYTITRFDTRRGLLFLTGNDSGRFLIGLSLLRIFSASDSLRSLFFGLLLILPK